MPYGHLQQYVRICVLPGSVEIAIKGNSGFQTPHAGPEAPHFDKVAAILDIAPSPGSIVTLVINDPAAVRIGTYLDARWIALRKHRGERKRDRGRHAADPGG